MNLFDEAHPFPDLQPKFFSDLRRWLAQQRGLLRRLGDAWTARRRHARSMAELYRFTDRELSDVALSRADVRSIAEGRFHRD